MRSGRSGGRGGRRQMSIAVAPGLRESRPAKEFEDEASDGHEEGHADAKSDDRRHVGFQPGAVRN